MRSRRGKRVGAKRVHSRSLRNVTSGVGAIKKRRMMKVQAGAPAPRYAGDRVVA